MNPTRLTLCLSLLLSLATAQDPETVQEFKRYFKKYKEKEQRVEAVLALEGIESPEVVDLLLPVLKSEEPEVTQAVVRVLGGFTERAPVNHMLAVLEKQKRPATRTGLLRAFVLGGYSPLGEPVYDCLRDKSWTIRRLAVQAVAAAAEVGAAAQIAPLCSDREVPVRCAAFDALAALGSELVLAPAREALAEEAWQVRASAIEALGRVRHRDSIAPLIERLKSEQGRLKADVAAALEALTARGLGQRVELWERFWNSYKDRYQIPTDEELALLRQRQAERSQEYEPSAGSVTFHGVDSPSRKLLFVIDVSGSMENEVVEKERFEEGEYPSFSRMEIVKTELARTIANLESYVEFNILAFATEVKAWKKRPVKANVLSKSSAATFIKRLEPIGGASRQDLARVGLVGAASLGAGKTNTYAALSQALELDRGAQDEYRTSVDTIFFFSDGKPTHGRFIDTSEILTQVREGNALRRVVIHAIALGQFDKTFMERLALENNGVFVDLGK